MLAIQTSRISRRQFLTRSALAAGGVALVGCDLSTAPAQGSRGSSRLLARPIATPSTPRTALDPGVTVLLPGTTPEMLLFVPDGYTPTRATPLAVMLHGAGGTNDNALAILRAHANALGMLILAPQSVGTTWDMIYGPFGFDVTAIDRALTEVFRVCNVDAARVGLAGFSDGASYALSLGLANGDLFTRLVAFSPGILDPDVLNGKPTVFVSHGSQDGVLNIDRTSRLFVPALRNSGYAVTYREFVGPHTVPVDIAADGAAFLAA